MPIKYLIENRARLLAFHFDGDVLFRQIEDAANAAVREASPGTAYHGILVFHGSTDLSKIGADELRTIKTVMNAACSGSAAQRPSVAIVIDGALDARMIMPLWKAVCDADSENEIHYRFFIEVAPTLAWLDVLETPTLRRFLTASL